MDKDITSRLSEIVGEEDISTSPFERELYGHDTAPIPGLLSLFFKSTPDVVVRPESADEVARILCLASDRRVPVIPRGGASWALGGVMPVKGGAVLDLIKLNRIRELSTDGLWVEVGAGIVWQDLMEQLAEKGVTVRSYPTSAPSSTVAGWISTGGYGIGSLQYGHLREQIEAIEVVTPKGEILSVSRDSTDPAFEWFFGTEGQLGVLTSVRLKLRRTPEASAVRGVYVPAHEELGQFVGELTALREVPYCLKILDSGVMALRSMLSGAETEKRNLVLAAFEGSTEEVREATAAFDNVVRGRGLQSMDPASAEAEWAERYYPMRIGRLGPTLLGGETMIPVNRLASFLKGIQSLQKKHGLRIGTEAHVISRGWAVVLALYLADEREALRYLTRLSVIRDIVKTGLDNGGRPYGLGLWHAVYVKQQLSQEYLTELKGLKRRFDPQGVLNPGKFFRAETRFGIPISRPLYDIMMAVLSFTGRLQWEGHRGDPRATDV